MVPVETSTFGITKKLQVVESSFVILCCCLFVFLKKKKKKAHGLYCVCVLLFTE